MLGIKLYTILRTFNRREIKSFTAFTASPFFNRKDQLTQLLNHIVNFYPDFDDVALDRKKLHKVAFGAEKNQQGQLSRLMSELTKLAKQFLIFQELKSKDAEQNRLLFQALGKKNLAPYSFNELNQFKEKMEAKSNRDLHYYRDMLLLYHEQYFHLPNFNFPKSNESIHELMSYLDRFFVASKLWYSCELYARKAILNERPQILLLDEIKQAIGEHAQLETPLIPLYQSILHFHEHPFFELKEFKKLIQEFKQSQSLLLKIEQKNIFRHLINLAYIKMNSQLDSRFTKQIFQLFKFGLEQNLILINQAIPEITYTTIIVVGSALSEFSWVEQFINKYQHFLLDDVKDNAVTLGKAYFLFHQGKFSDVIELLQVVKFINQSYTLRARTLLIRSHFELLLSGENSYKVVFYQLEAFKRNLYRTAKSSETKKRAYLNFLAILKKLVDAHLKGQGNEQVRLELDHIINQKQPIIAIQWLQSKIEES
ncbi:MAG: hypothetical protein AAF985_10875 [Bacteroidota bacterium]